MPKVSVIVPVYNVEMYLEKCLESLVHQTLQDIEIIVVNDGSTDESQYIINRFIVNYPSKVFAFDKPNGGLSDARNFGIDRASGDYLAFVDSDDYVTPTMLEEMYDLAIKNDAEMVICNIQKVNERGEVTQPLTQLPHKSTKMVLKEHFDIFSDISYFACNKLFKKELFDGKRFKKGAHFEDIQLIPQILLQCTIVAQTQNFHYQYLERSDSITKTHTSRGLDILRAVRDVEQAFENSAYKMYTKDLKGFQILEGVYTFLAYLAFVKDETTFYQMSAELDAFIKERNITTLDIITYKRFGKNYLSTLPIKKMIYYGLYMMKCKKLIRKLLN